MATPGQAEIEKRLRGRKNALNRQLDGHAPEDAITKGQYEEARSAAAAGPEFRAPRGPRAGTRLG